MAETARSGSVPDADRPVSVTPGVLYRDLRDSVLVRGASGHHDVLSGGGVLVWRALASGLPDDVPFSRSLGAALRVEGDELTEALDFIAELQRRGLVQRVR